VLGGLGSFELAQHASQFEPGSARLLHPSGALVEINGVLHTATRRVQLAGSESGDPADELGRGSHRISADSLGHLLKLHERALHPGRIAGTETSQCEGSHGVETLGWNLARDSPEVPLRQIRAGVVAAIEGKERTGEEDLRSERAAKRLGADLVEERAGIVESALAAAQVCW
jgi:hypothetical protein